MRILVCGGRNFDDEAGLGQFLNELAQRIGIVAVIEGDARGADRMAGEWARRNGIENVKFCADWENLGRKAGPIRNQRMLDEGMPDLVQPSLADGGTADMVRRAKAAGIKVMEVTSEKPQPDFR